MKIIPEKLKSFFQRHNTMENKVALVILVWIIFLGFQFKAYMSLMQDQIRLNKEFRKLNVELLYIKQQVSPKGTGSSMAIRQAKLRSDVDRIGEKISMMDHGLVIHGQLLNELMDGSDNFINGMFMKFRDDVFTFKGQIEELVAHLSRINAVTQGRLENLNNRVSDLEEE